jgi:hypothetical protein
VSEGFHDPYEFLTATQRDFRRVGAGVAHEGIELGAFGERGSHRDSLVDRAIVGHSDRSFLQDEAAVQPEASAAVPVTLAPNAADRRRERIRLRFIGRERLAHGRYFRRGEGGGQDDGVCRSLDGQGAVVLGALARVVHDVDFSGIRLKHRDEADFDMTQAPVVPSVHGLELGEDGLA